MQSDEEASFDALFAGVRLSSLLNSPHHTTVRHHHLPPLPPYLTGESSSSTFPFFSETYSGDLKMPKHEILSGGGYDHYNQIESVQNLGDFHRLPNLHSLEESQPNRISIAESSSSFSKRTRTLSASDYTLDAIVRSFKLRSLTPAYESHLTLARKTRAKIGDRARCLQSLMPWEKKLTMSNLLEQAFKYVKFLQAQISALESMPYQSSYNVQNQIGNPRNGGNRSGFGHQSISSESSYLGRQSGQSIACESRYLGQMASPSNELWRLNRQELLEILVNSKVAQNMMYSQECCVYSIEQLVLLKKIGQRRFLMQQQQLMFGYSKID